jgi:hypothetical protein
MLMITSEKAITQTQQWIQDVIIGCNFCPFASKAVTQKKVYYHVESGIDMMLILENVISECIRLDNDDSIETSFIIYIHSFADFDEYLQLIDLAETLMQGQGYDGVYQLASFHPAYLFAGSNEEDAANYTNRSPYPMLHLLREESIEQAIARYENPDEIPNRNIAFAHAKGLAYMKMLRDSCL